MAGLKDDFRVFDLRREDLAYERPNQKWGDISLQYFFAGFERLEDDALSGKNEKSLARFRMFDLLDQLYRSQATSDGREFRRLNMEIRDYQPIRSEQIDKKWKDVLVKAISEKEKALSYLSESYRSVVKKHRQVEMLTLGFYLPFDEGEGNIRRIKDDTHFRLQLGELERRFTLLRKRIIADPLYKSACGYSRVILINARFEPFYLVNFFFKKNPDSLVDGLVSSDIYSKWVKSGKQEYSSYEQVDYYRLNGASLLYEPKTSRLFVRRPERIVDVGQFPVSVSSVSSKKITFDNNHKGYLALFRLQAQIYNVIPGTRTLTCSDDFTYINSAEKKRRKAKKSDSKKKSKTALLIDEHSALPGNVLHDTEGSFQNDEFNDVLPSNLEEHMYGISKEEMP
ncbi:hypothetical protein R0H17_07785 [Phytobacter diazotrophicus]|uniref:hypothetical protein n=1 Tax=Phytobacter diazotrophicus TaxID=395631 RepID=UPI002936D464|nr:hypothetical protein [Phytobacter diazotrophicus]MDV2901528.1 hypothetical protein [Phytobacter diazotrophicus]